ncbi:integrase core domain-containing protein [Bradyrhizobium sp. ORS 3257]|uniref:integrase core domain-containing protein n=1 Tax=Bradyrhizobium vignae TaxID=1549949 RepID=UPI000EFF9452
MRAWKYPTQIVETSYRTLLLVVPFITNISPAPRERGRLYHQRSAAELLNETMFTSLGQARSSLKCWRADYNAAQPHSQAG